MDYENISIAKVTGKCPACEEYAARNSTTPPKIAVMACEGACARGEVARRAANLVAHRLARDATVRICLGGAFTKDTGQRNLVRMAEKVIAIEGCFINCSSRMMAGVIPGLTPEVVRADLIYNHDLPFGIDEVPDEMFTIYAYQVAERVVQDYVKGSPSPGLCPPPACSAGPAGACGCTAPMVFTSTESCNEGSARFNPEFLPPDVVTVLWDGSKRFRMQNLHGGSMILEEGAGACSPCDAFMGALGGCANLAVLAQLEKRGKVPDMLQTRVSGTRTAGTPSAYERIHVTFSLDTDLDDADLNGILGPVMTALCPVAVTLGRAAEITWDYRRELSR